MALMFPYDPIKGELVPKPILLPKCSCIIVYYTEKKRIGLH